MQSQPLPTPQRHTQEAPVSSPTPLSPLAHTRFRIGPPHSTPPPCSPVPPPPPAHTRAHLRRGPRSAAPPHILTPHPSRPSPPQGAGFVAPPLFSPISALTCVQVQDLPHLLVCLSLRSKRSVALLPQELPADRHQHNATLATGGEKRLCGPPAADEGRWVPQLPAHHLPMNQRACPLPPPHLPRHQTNPHPRPQPPTCCG
jgi:hypothetical protein